LLTMSGPPEKEPKGGVPVATWAGVDVAHVNAMANAQMADFREMRRSFRFVPLSVRMAA